MKVKHILLHSYRLILVMTKSIQAMIVGAQKSGTTSLATYLAQHPNICTHKRTEMSYFIKSEEYKLGYKRAYSSYFSHCDCQDEKTIILAKNVGVMYWREATERLYNHNPDCKIFVVLRNPVDRAYSAYWYARRMGWENIQTFEEAIAAESSRPKYFGSFARFAYLDRGVYDWQIENLINTFQKKNVHVFIFEDFKKNSRSVCKTIFDILDISSDHELSLDKQHNKSAMPQSKIIPKLILGSNPIKKMFLNLVPKEFAWSLKSKILSANESTFSPPKMSPETKLNLIEYFSPHNLNLEKILQMDLSIWNH